MPKTVKQRESEVDSLQKQLVAKLSAAKVTPSAEFQAAFKSFLDNFVTSGVEISQLFSLTGYALKINVMLNAERQSIIMLQK